MLSKINYVYCNECLHLLNVGQYMAREEDFFRCSK